MKQQKISRGESVGELIEKLVIANIKLWMVKDAQTAFLSVSKNRTLLKNLVLLERTEVLDEAAPLGINHYKKFLSQLEKKLKQKDMVLVKDLIRRDIELCEVRASLRRNINLRLHDTNPADTVKKYGNRK